MVGSPLVQETYQEEKACDKRQHDNDDDDNNNNNNNNDKRTCMVIDVAVSRYGNVLKKEAEMILKYTELKIEIWGMRSIKSKMIPVITGCTETISK